MGGGAVAMPKARCALGAAVAAQVVLGAAAAATIYHLRKF
jgi:hypothetical protein